MNVFLYVNTMVVLLFHVQRYNISSKKQEKSQKGLVIYKKVCNFAPRNPWCETDKNKT